MRLTLYFLVSLFVISHSTLINLNPKIVAGRIAKPGEIPYQASLQHIKSKHNFCGGIILNRDYILTAAHCMTSESAELIWAVVGTTDLQKPYAKYLIESFYVHKEYDRDNSWINDIALLKVKSPFKFSTLVSPVKLPQQNQTVKSGAIAVVSGYGRLSYNGNKTKELNVASIQIADQSYCKYVYQKTQNIFDTHICAYEPSIKRGSCKGDSGGPLTVDGELVGIVSWSHHCSDTIYPAVYTRVPLYIDWIKKHAV